LSESQDSFLKVEAEFIRINVVDNDFEHAGLLVDTRRGTEGFDCDDAGDSEAHPKLNPVISAQFISIMI
jgi:hypothetical protein